ncbi:hypothetical protein AB1K91_02625 [Terribacillus sp. 179-K 1B1 HS]|uniref:hypothetical protein n=1 Tax=Terribacillus sp. 179-K 1B1 HS TaxID=3142388 RepID=UPI0039A26212
MTINVVDSIMGSGKTSWAINYMNKADKPHKFIYITPYLSEVERIQEQSTRDFIAPNNNNSEGSKLRSLKELIVSGCDIVSTHSLFQASDDELIDLLTDAGYTLILDEVMDVIEQANITKRDITDLQRLGHIQIVDNKVVWNCDEYVEGRYLDIKLLANSNNLFYHRGQFLIWAFPPQVFRAFDNVFILTYLFDAQIQRYYFDLYSFDYKYNSVQKQGTEYVLASYDRSSENRQELFNLIDLYEGKLNEIGDRENAFSSSYLGNMSAEIEEEIRNNIYNYFRNIAKAKSKEILWTTVKKAKSGHSGRGYTRSFLQCNARATNEYSDRKALAYVFNRYMNPLEKAFFQDNGVKVNQDLLAVSDLLQWIYRSRIRNGQPIQLYLPSSRMRRVLREWAEYKL